MTIRQKFLKNVYPLFSIYKKLFGNGSKILANKENIRPAESFYTLSVRLINGQELKFDELIGKKVLLVNTASNCGFTAQYRDLERLYENKKDKLIVVGFPANDFKEQEKGSDEEIAQFCASSFGITFPLAKKNCVVKGPKQQDVYKWLTNREKNGWNSYQPSWNFAKYLVNEQGVLINYFGPGVLPLGKEIKQAIDE
ncbi:MAG TPA: glutathione peroxidase [Chitinophagaceae bacterium]